MAVPPREPASSRGVPSESGREFEKDPLPFRAASPEEARSIEFLRDLISAGEQRLDLVLSAIADAAWGLTGASGSALAMWKNGAMVCRARSGETAPPLGAQLNLGSGISGECLRTGAVQYCADTENNPLVDVEVCRTLGWRSIAVLPIRGWRGVNGILEVFSTVSSGFSTHQIALLKELAALAERARSLQPHGASQVQIRESGKEPAKDQPSGREQRGKLLPASDRVGEVALAAVGGRSRRFVLRAIGVAAVALVGLAIWLGWRGGEEREGTQRMSQSPAATVVPSRPSEAHVPDTDPVWKPNPGGERLFPSSGKAPASPVQFASKTIVIEPIETRAAGNRAPLSWGASNATAPRGSAATGNNATQSSHAAAIEQPNGLEPPPLPGATPLAIEDSPSINGVLAAKATLPALLAPVSEGITGGQLLHSVSPVYPARAKAMHVEGRVVLSATVEEDGSVSGFKVVQGPPILAEAAEDAAKQWRYQPFRLDGKPIARDTTITFDFKF